MEERKDMLYVVFALCVVCFLSGVYRPKSDGWFGLVAVVAIVGSALTILTSGDMAHQVLVQGVALDGSSDYKMSVFANILMSWTPMIARGVGIALRALARQQGFITRLVMGSLATAGAAVLWSRFFNGIDLGAWVLPVYLAMCGCLVIAIFYDIALLIHVVKAVKQRQNI